MGKSPKNTRVQKIVIVEVYPDDLAGTLMPGDLELLKDRYGNEPCSYEIHYPWKNNAHFAWYVDEVYEKYGDSHIIIRQKSE